jgi:glycosyltransferase EpsJ
MKELYSYWGIDNAEVREFLARRYVERLIGCVENVTNKNCTLSNKEKRKEIKRMISTNTAKAYLKTAEPKSVYMKLMLVPVKMNSACLTKLEGSVISYVKSGNTKLFARLKAGR